MVRSILLSAALAAGLATSANAWVSPAPVGDNDHGIIRVAEGCGGGRWRAPDGSCQWFHTGGGSLRGTHFACPPGIPMATSAGLTDATA